VGKGQITSWSCDPSANGYTPMNDYVLGLSGEELTELTANGGGGMLWQNTNVYAAGTLIATYDTAGLHFLLNDMLGTRRAQTDYAGVLEQTCSSLPFGDTFGNQPICTQSDQSPNALHFTGKERDAESGLDYFGARYLASSMGRFTSPDPMLNSGRPDNPQTWNRYSYALNNPLTVTDPTGMYNLVNNCAGDDSKCNKAFAQDAKNLKNGLADLTKAVNGMKDGDQKTALQGALGAIGTENDGNNVGVQFGKNADGAAGNTQLGVDANGGLKFTVTFDPSMNQGGVSQAINAAHEGQHVEDISDPRFASNATILSPFSLEYRGYQTSAYAASALGQSSISFGKNGQYPIWNGSWGAVDKNLTNYITSFRDKSGQPDHPETTPHDPWKK
jgi:RHS repeat-associated protein